MSFLQGLYPPSQEQWEFLLACWKCFPLVTLLQWVGIEPMFGKTSWDSRFNIPGKIGWATMECPGFINLLYIMFTLPKKLGIERLPIMNWVMAGLFVLHYINRCFIGPYVSPSMSPIHVVVWLFAFCWQLANTTCLGGWLAGYGAGVSDEYWADRPFQIYLGVILFLLGLTGNIWHDDELRELRRRALRDQEKTLKERDEKEKKGVDKVYLMPENGLFKWILYPHYVTEWTEWTGFWLIGGPKFTPGMLFVVNEIATMLPRAINGKKWYKQRLGEAKVGRKGAVIYGVL